jgi:glycosyltransferase involved in cell wall biosynthesis
MKILSVATFAHPEYFGGAERMVSVVAEGLASRGHEVTLLTGQGPDTLAEERRNGVRVIRYPFIRGSPTTFYRSVWAGVRKALVEGVGRDADLIHLHQPLSAVAAIAPGTPRKLPRLYSFYAPYHLEYLARYREGRDTGGAPWPQRAVASLLRRADRYLLTRSEEVVVLSSFSLRQIEALAPGVAARTTVAPAGVDLEHFSPPMDDEHRRACRSRLGLDDDGTPWLLTVRRLVPRMGIEDLLDACAVLAGDGIPFRLAIAGEGEHREALERRTADLGLGSRVRFLGRVPDDRLIDLYRAAEIFVLPTRSLEGFGMVTAEALAAGLVVVATDAGATAELLTDVPGTHLVPAGSPTRLAAALANVLADEPGRRTAARAARAHAESQLTWDRHLNALEQAARRLTEGAP